MADLHRYDCRVQGTTVHGNIQAQSVQQAKDEGELDVQSSFPDVDFTQATQATLIEENTSPGPPPLNQYEVTTLWRRNVIIDTEDKQQARVEAKADSNQGIQNSLVVQSVRFLKEKTGVST